MTLLTTSLIKLKWLEESAHTLASCFLPTVACTTVSTWQPVPTDELSTVLCKPSLSASAIFCVPHFYYRYCCSTSPYSLIFVKLYNVTGAFHQPGSWCTHSKNQSPCSGLQDSAWSIYPLDSLISCFCPCSLHSRSPGLYVCFPALRLLFLLCLRCSSPWYAWLTHLPPLSFCSNLTFQRGPPWLLSLEHQHPALPTSVPPIFLTLFYSWFFFELSSTLLYCSLVYYICCFLPVSVLE